MNSSGTALSSEGTAEGKTGTRLHSTEGLLASQEGRQTTSKETSTISNISSTLDGRKCYGENQGGKGRGVGRSVEILNSWSGKVSERRGFEPTVYLGGLPGSRNR